MFYCYKILISKTFSLFKKSTNIKFGSAPINNLVSKYRSIRSKYISTNSNCFHPWLSIVKETEYHLIRIPINEISPSENNPPLKISPFSLPQSLHDKQRIPILGYNIRNSNSTRSHNSEWKNFVLKTRKRRFRTAIDRIAIEKSSKGCQRKKVSPFPFPFFHASINSIRLCSACDSPVRPITKSK